MEFSDAVKKRRSVRKFDPTKPLDAKIVKHCIELATLAPNSSNMQLWEFYHITSPDKLKKMSEFCFDQNAAKTARQMVVLVTRKDLWKKRMQAHVRHMEAEFGKKKKEEYSSRERFAFTYYKKIVPVTYADFFGILGWVKYFAYWMIGLFRPIYRQARKSDMRVVVHKTQALAAQTFMLAMTDAGYDTCPMEGSDTLRIKRLLGLPYGAEINMVIACGVRLPEGVYGKRFRIPFEEVYKEV
jgi:nitroreductase